MTYAEKLAIRICDIEERNGQILERADVIEEAMYVQREACALAAHQAILGIVLRPQQNLSEVFESGHIIEDAIINAKVK